MAASAWAFYDQFLLAKNNGTLDLDTDVIKVGLYLSTSNAATLTLTTVASITNEHANGNGYTTGGDTVTPTLTGESQNVNWDLTDAEWTASGGSITARFAVIYSGTTPIAYSLLDTTPADVTATDGNTFTVAPHADGVFDESPV